MRYAIAFVLFIWSASPAWAETDWQIIPDPSFEPESHDMEVVKVRQVSMKGHGSGFFVEDDLVVTAAHVLFANDPREEKEGPFEPDVSTHVIVTNFQGENAIGETVYVDIVSDFAIIHLLTDIESLPVGLNFDPLSRGEEVHMIGNTLIWEWAYTSGIVSQVPAKIEGTERILLGLSVAFGDSGGPLYNAYGEVIGVITQVIAVGGLALALPITSVEDILLQAIQHSEFLRNYGQ